MECVAGETQSPPRRRGSLVDRQQVNSEMIKLNVGGTPFVTSKATLTVDSASFFGRLLSGSFSITKDEDGSIFVDRDGTHFRHILNFLRDGTVPYHLDKTVQLELALEAHFYNLTGLVNALDKAGSIGTLHDINLDSLRLDFEEWERNETLTQKKVLGDRLIRLVGSIMHHVQEQVCGSFDEVIGAQVRRGQNKGMLPLLMSGEMPPEMSFNNRGLTPLPLISIDPDGSLSTYTVLGHVVALVPPNKSRRELPLMYHDWQGSSRKMDFIRMQEEVWATFREQAYISADCEIMYKAELESGGVAQVSRELASRKFPHHLRKEQWLHLTTPVYSDQPGASAECPVVADFCQAYVLRWDLFPDD